MRLFLIMLCSLLSFSPLNSYCNTQEIDVTQEVRIQQLISPDRYAFFLGVEPAIPKDFIALDPQGGTDYGDWVYWGPQDVLKAYFKDRNSLSRPIIRARISLNVSRSEIENFDKNKMKIIGEFAQGGAKMDRLKSGAWGFHPYISVVGSEAEGGKFYMAWVRAEGRSNTVLQFELVYPEKKAPSPEGIELWERFLNETKELPEPLFFKTSGQEMHEGYTIVNVFGCKVKVIAEMRKSDRKVQFAFIPLNPNIEFTFKDALRTHMEPDWHHGEPLLKVMGTFNVDNGHIIAHTTTSVLIKETAEFTSIPLHQKNVLLRQL